MPKSPALPWEVIERVIDHSAGRTRTLYSFTLTCRDLRPRSTILLLVRVKLKDRDRLFDLCATLQTKPHLQPCVRSVEVPAHEFSPHPLLRMLPNLFEIKFTRNRKTYPALTFHPSVLTSCRQYGQHIQTLSLSHLKFSSTSAFVNILLSLPMLKSLSCDGLRVKNDGVRQELAARRLSGRLHLTTLGIHGNVNSAILALLREVTKHRLTILAHTDVDAYRADRAEVREDFVKLFLASPSDWIQLNSLTWEMPTILYKDKSKERIQQVISVLQNFRPPKLREVIVVFRFPSLQGFLVKVLPFASELCGDLEKALVAFSRPIVSFSPRPEPKFMVSPPPDSKLMISPPYHINGRRHHSWMHMIEKSFPVLAKRRALVLDAEPSGYAGHDGEIWTPIVISADSRWAATGSEDGTIIIWDLESGCISQEWFAEPHGVGALAFSPDGRYVMLASGKEVAGSGTGATIWDLHGVCKVRSLMREDVGDTYCNMHCAWSPDGSWIAAGPQADGAVHVWETTTFERLHFWNAIAWKGRLLAFSADGCWIATADQSSGRPDDFDCCIWDVHSGKLHQSLRGHINTVCAAAFNLERTRVATGSKDSTIRIWDAETGAQLLVLEGQAARWG